MAIFAYHGTPHNVDKFSTLHIGSGEGAQAYGWGLYFADNIDVAKWYKDKLGCIMQIDGDDYDHTNPFHLAKKTMVDNKGYRTLAIGDLRRQAKYTTSREDRTFFTDAADFLRDKLDLTSPFAYKYTGNLYRVSIDGSSEDFLLWDEPYIKQSLHVQSIIDSLDIPSKWTTGEEIYYYAHSELLLSLGVKGIKYLDGLSREMGIDECNYNYVVFDDSLIKIIEINGITVDEAPPEISIDNWHQDSHPLTKDKNGNPKVFYHGSDAVFDVFDKSLVGGNTQRSDSGVGFYFAYNKSGDLDSSASWYGENITEHHLKLVNPFVVPDEKAEMVKKIADVLPLLGTKDGISFSEYSKLISSFEIIYDSQHVSSSEGIFGLNTYHFGELTIRNVHPDESIYDRFLDNYIYKHTGSSLPLLRDVSSSVFTEMLKVAGFDGVISSDEVVVFEPAQISKAAAGLSAIAENIFPEADTNPSSAPQVKSSFSGGVS